MNCKHEIKHLELVSKYDSSPDGYGGRDEWNWTELHCKKCGNFVKAWDAHQTSYIQEKNYTDLTKRSVGLKEMINLFKQNNKIYWKMMSIFHFHDAVQRTVGKRTDALEKKIIAKKKVIKKHEEQLALLQKDWDGR